MSELPAGWMETSFMNIFDIQGGTQPPKKEFKYTPQTGYIRLLQIRDFGNKPVPTYIPFKKSLKVCHDKEILIGRYGASIGRICTGMSGAYNVALAKVIVPEGLDQKFVYYLLQSNSFQKPILDIERSAQDGFNKDDLKEILLPIAPFNEQRRIAAKLEKLLGKVEAGQQRLAKIPLILKRFRQAVLAAACSGRLTTDWREQNPDIESGEELANAIASQRERDIAVEIISEDCPDTPIPSRWTWVRFGSVIGELRNGASPRPTMEPVGTPILRISSTRSGSVGLDDVRYLLNGKDYLPQFALSDGDLLFTRYNGSLELLGVCGMVRGLGDRTLLYPDKLMRVRFDHTLILPAYVEIFFQTHEAHERITAKSKSSAGQNGISGSDLKSQPLALPPLPEQQEIVYRVEALFEVADQLEARYRKAKVHVDKLTQSILAKAFRGELVPTEAELARQEGRDYEPASALLERIRQERNQPQTAAKPARKARKKRDTATKGMFA